MQTDAQIFGFVLMPFDKAFDDIYKLGIKETANALSILAERVDEQIFQEGILERIYRQIELADVIVADMTGQNPNVFYEVGYAHAKGKLCILLTQRPEDIPFDLKHHRHIIYGNSIQALRQQLTDELAWAKSQIEVTRSSRIKVTLKDASGSLEKTKVSAYGMVDFKIDLHNDAASASVEVDAIYFYLGTGWTLKQDGQECPSSDSDLPNYKTRHFLKPPVRRLNRNSWAQLKFSGRKRFAYALIGQKLKDSYHVTGRALVRLVTVDGNFDYEISLDVQFDEVPF